MFLKVVFSFILIFGKYINLIEDGRMDARSFCFDIKIFLILKKFLIMKYFIFIITLFTFISCDPGYAYYISNNSEKDIYVITKPPIKVYDKNIYGRELDSAIIKPKETFRIFGSIGYGGGEDSFPFHQIIINKENDSIVLKDKSEINKIFNQNRKKKIFSATYTLYVN